jgi:hypothetical protein
MSVFRGGSRIRWNGTVADMRSNNAFERSVEHRGPRLAAAKRLWPAAQLGR